MDEQLNRESKKWESEIAALKLEVATGKEYAKVCVCLLYPYYAYLVFHMTIFSYYSETCRRQPPVGQF